MANHEWTPLLERFDELDRKITKLKQELDALWLHIRCLEQKLLNAIEVPPEARIFQEIAKHFQVVTKSVVWPLDEPDVD